MTLTCMALEISSKKFMSLVYSIFLCFSRICWLSHTKEVLSHQALPIGTCKNILVQELQNSKQVRDIKAFFMILKIIVR